MPEENIIAEPSEENGNVPPEELGTITPPSEQPEDGSNGETKTPETVMEPELYELPDGRKVDGVTLAREFKENFLPDYTKKSQALAEIERNNINNTPEEKPYQKPGWTPKDWPEVIQIAKQEIKGDLEQQEKQRVEQRKALEDSIVNEITELKKADPTLNENTLFLHANEYREKYGVVFPSLKAAYAHMQDVHKLTKNVQETTAKNIAKRADPVSTTNPGGPTGNRPDPSNFGSAVEYLRSLTK